MVLSASENTMPFSKFQRASEGTNQIILLTMAHHQPPSGSLPKLDQELSPLSKSEPELTNYVDEMQADVTLSCTECFIHVCHGSEQENSMPSTAFVTYNVHGVSIIVSNPRSVIIYVERSDRSLGTLCHCANLLSQHNAQSVSIKQYNEIISIYKPVLEIFIKMYNFLTRIYKELSEEVKNKAPVTWNPSQLLLTQEVINISDGEVQEQNLLRKDTSFGKLLSGSMPESLLGSPLLSQPEFQPEYLIVYKPSPHLEKTQLSIRKYNDIASIYKEVLEAKRELMKIDSEMATTTRRRNCDITQLSLLSAVRHFMQDTSHGSEVVPCENRNVRCVTENIRQKGQSPLRTLPPFWKTPLLRVNRDDEECGVTESHDFECTDLDDAKPLEATQPIALSSTNGAEQEDFQQQASAFSGMNSPLMLVDASQEAAGSETADDQDMFKCVMGLLLSELKVLGCRDYADLASYNTERLAIYVMSRQPLRRIVGALERLAFAPANERDSTTHSIELFRLISFTKWPHIGKMSTLKFSLAGFQYAGSSDTVSCRCCCLSLRGWTALAQPLDIHRQRCGGRCQLIGDPSLSSNVPLSRATDVWSFSHEEASRAANLSATMEGTGVATAAFSSSSVAAACYRTIFRCYASNNDSKPGSEDFNKQSGIFSFLKDPTAIPRNSERETLNAVLRDQREHEELWKFESYRLRTYDGRWQHGHIVQPGELARSGFHYTGPGDRVQCAFCQGALRNWEAGDRPNELHTKHFNYCRFVQGHDVGNVPIPFSALAEATCTTAGDASSVPGTAAPVGLGIFSSVPKHVDFAVESRRLATFATWPSLHPLRADSVAQAGFFYTGVEDAVTCFFCNGTVSGFTAGSDPWQEHAHRFPTCPYLLQVKGPDIVEQQSTLNASASGSSTQRKHFAVDPREIRARMDTPCVRVVLKMDYPVELVREVIQRRLSTLGRDHETSEELLADIFSVHDEKQRTTTPESKAAPMTPIVVTQSSAATPTSSSYSESHLIATAASAPAFGDPSLASAAGPDRAPTSMATQRQPPDEENRQLKTQLTCKICMDAVVGIIFLPCGHLVSCAACAPALASCPICRVSVRGTARVTF